MPLHPGPLRWITPALLALAAAWAPSAAAAAPVTGVAIGLTPTQAVVTAGGGARADARVAYGRTAPAYGATAAADDGVPEFTLTGLTPATTYHYRVEVPAANGAWTPGPDRTLVTRPAGAPELVTRPEASDVGTPSCTDGTWSGVTSVASTSWLLVTAPETGGTAVTTFDKEGDYACRVTATGTGGATSFMTSRTVHYAPPPPFAPTWSQRPSITRSGSTLVCSPGTWLNATTLTYSWERDGSALAGEAATEHAISAGDLGHVLVCVVTATGPGGSVPEPSEGFAVPAPPPAPPQPVVLAPKLVTSTVASSSEVVPDPVLVAPTDGDRGASGGPTGPVSALGALRTLLASAVPTRARLRSAAGATLRFRPPAPLGMLRVKLLGAGASGPVLAAGARWFDEVRPGAVRMRLTAAGRRALTGSGPVEVVLLATFVPDHGRIQSESRRLVLRS